MSEVPADRRWLPFLGLKNEGQSQLSYSRQMRRADSARIGQMANRLALLYLLLVTGSVFTAGQNDGSTKLTLFFNGYVRGSFEPCG